MKKQDIQEKSTFELPVEGHHPLRNERISNRTRLKISDLRLILDDVRQELRESSFSPIWTVDSPNGGIRVHLTARLLERSHRERTWASPGFCATLRNTFYGFDESYARSYSRRDGIFLLDRGFTPKNEMQHKIFDRFLDKPDPLVSQLCNQFNVEISELTAVRVVGHHMRLLGVMFKAEGLSNLILVDSVKNRRG